MNTLASAPPATEPSQASLEGFCERLRAYNPFLSNRINEPTADDPGVPGIHESALTRLLELARAAHAQRCGIGVLLWGEAGIGKSHLLARFHRWAAEANHGCCVYLHNLSASPDNLPRSVLKTVISILTRGRVRQLQYAPLYHLAFAGLREALGHDTTRTHPWPRAEQAWNLLIDRLAAASPGRAALIDRSVYDVLFRFLHSVNRLARGKVDGLAPLALRWLAGDYLDADEARRLGLPLGRHRDDALALADNQQIKQVLVALAQLALWQGRPLVLCFDQVDNLDVEQAAALARFLEALLDSAPNLLVVTAGIQSSLANWRAAGVIQASAWDRLAQFEVPLLRIPVEAGRQLVADRLERFLTPFEGVVQRWLRADALFPLGRAWEKTFFNGRLDVRPRDVISSASECWRQERAELDRQGAQNWFDTWGERQGLVSPAPPPSLDERIDHRVAERMAEHRASRREEDLPPDADSLKNVVFKLIEQWRQADPTCGIAGLDVATRTTRRPAHDAVLRRRSADGQDVRLGLLFLVAEHGRTTAMALMRVIADESPPQHVLLVTDGRKPLPLGPIGKEYLATLRQRGPEHFQEVAVSFDEYTELEALLAATRAARSGDLDLAVPGEPAHVVSETEVIASHQRQGRYRNAPVLRALA